MKTTLNVGAFIEKDGKILLVKKKGKWELPLSKLDKGVNILKDLIRDMETLTGFVVEPDAVVGIFEDLLEKEQIIRIYFKTKIIGGEQKAGEWFTIKDIQNMDIEERGRISSPVDNYRLEKFVPLDFIEKFKGV
jgi:ADP-ribose pyrophosphatase YjhB (NUDIX family)